MSLHLTENIGIEMECGIFMPVFCSGQKLPCKQCGILLSPSSENQTELILCVRQGEYRKAEYNVFLGELCFHLSSPGNRMFPEVEVDFFIDCTGKLLVRGSYLKKHEYQYLHIDLDFNPRRFFSEKEVEDDKTFSEFAALAAKAQRIIKSYNNMASRFDRNKEDKVYLSMSDDIIKAEKSLQENDYQSLKASVERLRSNFEEITFLVSSKKI